MKNRWKKQLNIILLTLMLITSGCSKNNSNSNPNKLSNTYSNEEDNFQIITNNIIIYTNDYKEYKKYLSELNPSYDLLRETIKSNKNIEGKYQQVLLKIVDIFEEKAVDTHNLAIFYENLKKERINTNHSINLSKEETICAYFTPDPDTPSITVDEANIDFYSFFHEVIHSCHELQIRVNDKIIYITSQGLNEELNNLDEKERKLYGLGYIEGQTEFICTYLCNSSKRLFNSSKNYNNANDIIDFIYDTQAIDFNTFFLLSVEDFKKILLDINIPEENVDKIISDLDYQISNIEESSFKTREFFYTNYVPRLIEQFITSGYSSKEIYTIIGSSLKTSVIENSHDLNELVYYKDYLNEQKKLFDTIDAIIMDTLNNHKLTTYSLYDFIGHEFSIYYSLYGEESSLDNENLYLAFNWDKEASLNSNILIYVEDDTLKMCNYIENTDGSKTCYDAFGEVSNITNGISLNRLTHENIVTIQNGYLRYYYYPEAIKNAILRLEITSTYQIDSIINNNNSYLYLSDSKAVMCSLTTNQDGKEIPYQISDNKVYVLPENAIKVGTLKELYEESIITYDEYGTYNINSEKLNDYLEEKEITTRHK